VEEARSLLAERLRERQPELKAAIATRIYAISDPRDVPDPAYLQGLNAALAAAIDHRIAVLEASERHAPPVPPALLVQARLDARDGVSLDTVLRRYFAGNALFGDFLAEEAERAEIPGPALRRLLATQATLFDRLLSAISGEHAREARRRPSGSAERRRECVKALLAGELIDRSELDYDLDAHHVALMAKGKTAREPMRRLATDLGRRLLAVCREEEAVWACWLGGANPLSTERVVRALGQISPDQVLITVGEPGEGLSGWRFSHRQAKAAMAVAERRIGRSPVRYADVAVLASIVDDDLLTASLHRLYLAPLERTRDRGKAARETLRAYFAAERNVSSTAAALGVDRRTVANRLRAVEELLGRPVKACATDLEMALLLSD
jgi:PucR C-terminal helix-turn-helix domain/GGDEF-like domain